MAHLIKISGISTQVSHETDTPSYRETCSNEEIGIMTAIYVLKIKERAIERHETHKAVMMDSHEVGYLQQQPSSNTGQIGVKIGRSVREKYGMRSIWGSSRKKRD